MKREYTMAKLRAIALLITITVGLGSAIAAVPACIHNAPASLSPTGQSDFYKTRVVKALDVVRDTAVDANNTVPPLMSTATTRAVVSYHESSLKVIDASAAGWQATVASGLDELLKNVSTSEHTILAPYVALAKVLLQEVH